MVEAIASTRTLPEPRQQLAVKKGKYEDSSSGSGDDTDASNATATATASFKALGTPVKDERPPLPFVTVEKYASIKRDVSHWHKEGQGQGQGRGWVAEVASAVAEWPRAVTETVTGIWSGAGAGSKSAVGKGKAKVVVMTLEGAIVQGPVSGGKGGGEEGGKAGGMEG